MNYKIQSVKIIRTWRPKFIAPHKLCLIKEADPDIPS